MQYQNVKFDKKITIFQWFADFFDFKSDKLGTESKLKRENIKTENSANKTHYEVGKEVRNTIKRLGGVMPENMPTPKKSLKELEKEKKDKIIESIKK